MLLPETQTSCYAWVLMSNHAHFLLKTGTAPIAKVMRRLLTGYVVSFNHIGTGGVDNSFKIATNPSYAGRMCICGNCGEVHPPESRQSRDSDGVFAAEQVSLLWSRFSNGQTGYALAGW